MQIIQYSAYNKVEYKWYKTQYKGEQADQYIEEVKQKTLLNFPDPSQKYFLQVYLNLKNTRIHFATESYILSYTHGKFALQSSGSLDIHWANIVHTKICINR